MKPKKLMTLHDFVLQRCSNTKKLLVILYFLIYSLNLCSLTEQKEEKKILIFPVH
jgi:hypothetical protein